MLTSPSSLILVKRAAPVKGSIDSISLSSDCEFPISCFADPCEVAAECELNTPVECFPNYCGGCYADFYDLNGDLVDCYSQSVLPCDDLGDLFFGRLFGLHGLLIHYYNHIMIMDRIVFKVK